MRSLSRAWMLGIATVVVAVASFAVAAPAGSGAEAEEHTPRMLSREVLEARLKAVEASSELDEPTRQVLVDLYHRSISNLQVHESQLHAQADFASSIDTAATRARALSEEIERVEREHFQPQLNIGDATPEEDIVLALLKARTDQLAVDSDLLHLLRDLAGQRQRLNDARSELEAASSQQSRNWTGEDAAAVVSTPALKRARRWYRETSALVLGSEIRMLDQELLSYNPRVELLKLQIRRREITASRLKQTAGLIESELVRRRQADADQAIAMTTAARLDAEGKHPLLLQIATENATISENLLAISADLEGVSAQLETLSAEVKSIREEYRHSRQKLEVAGMNKALGRILQDQRTSLPKLRRIRAELKAVKKQMTDLSLAQIVNDEHLAELSDVNAAADSLIEAFGEAHESSESVLQPAILMEQLLDLLEQRRQLYNKLGGLLSAKLQALGEVEHEQRRLVETVEDYEAFLAERLLWVRSVLIPGIQHLFYLSGDNLGYLSPVELRGLLDDLLELNLFTAPFLLGLLLVAALVYLRPAFRLRLLRSNRYLGDPLKDKFSVTPQALLITVLLSATGPLLLLCIAWKLILAAEPGALSTALGEGLRWLARNWFVFQLFYQVCRPEGLAHRHFRWHVPALKPLRHEVLLLMLTLLPVGFLTYTVMAMDVTAIEWGISRLGLILVLLIFAAFFLRILNGRGDLMKALAHSKKYVALVRLRWLWLSLSVLIPLILSGLTAYGYVYTAAVLTGSFIRSLWVIVLVMLVHQLFLRWLRMTATRLNYQTTRDERDRQLRGLVKESPWAPASAAKSFQEPGVDLAGLGRDSLKLVNALSAVVAVTGFLLVWSEVLLGLGYLRNIAIWGGSTITDGEAVIETLTLADLGLAMLMVAVIWFLYRNLPAALELVLLQVRRLSTSDRYTIITLIRYLILAVGIYYVAAMLSIEWSKFQWLLAALGVGIGFGLQEIVANFISGLIILFERPVRVGDRVTVGGEEGIVARIRIRATTIITWDRQELLVPNKQFITGAVLNWSLSDPVSRLTVDVGVAYGSDVSQSMAIIAEVAGADEQVLSKPAPFVTFEGFGDNTLNLRLRCYLDDMEERLMTRSRLCEGINREFARLGIEIAFPQRDVHFDMDRLLQIGSEGR